MTDWNRVVDEYGPVVFRIARRILGHSADAEEVCQETLFAAYQFAAKQKVENWPRLMRRLASLRSLDRLRQRKPTVALDEVSLAQQRDSPQASAIANELAQRLRAGLAQLPQQQAAVFALRYFEGLSNGEIAGCLDTSVSAVSTSLAKARATLGNLLGESVSHEHK